MLDTIIHILHFHPDPWSISEIPIKILSRQIIHISECNSAKPRSQCVLNVSQLIVTHGEVQDISKPEIHHEVKSAFLHSKQSYLTQLKAY